MNRRNALINIAGISGLTLASSLFAAPSQAPRLLLVFLRGAYDSNSLLVPISSNLYYGSRPDIAIARPSDSLASALHLSDDWGLHPAFRDSIYPLYKRGELAFIPFSGTHDLSRSHFETQDSMEMGQQLDGHKNYNSGFLNRLASVLTGSAPMSFTSQLPVVFRGDMLVANTGLRKVSKPSVNTRQSSIISSMYQDTSMAEKVSEGFVARDDVAQKMSSEMEAASRSAINSRGFEVETRRVASLMRDRYNIGFIDVGGWDTHVNQGAATGYLANRFEELGTGLATYAREMGPAWRDTTVVVVSEFGRTFRQNGSRGTDHGHGTAFLVMGGGVKGGRIAGEQLRIEQSTLFQNRDLPVLNEYREVLGGLFQRQYSLSKKQMETVFPGAQPKDIGLI